MYVYVTFFRKKHALSIHILNFAQHVILQFFFFTSTFFFCLNFLSPFPFCDLALKKHCFLCVVCVCKVQTRILGYYYQEFTTLINHSTNFLLDSYIAISQAIYPAFQIYCYNIVFQLDVLQHSFLVSYSQLAIDICILYTAQLYICILYTTQQDICILYTAAFQLAICTIQLDEYINIHCIQHYLLASYIGGFRGGG